MEVWNKFGAIALLFSLGHFYKLPLIFLLNL